MGGRTGDWVANRLSSRRWQLAACVAVMAAIASPQYAWTLFAGPLARGLQAPLSQVQVAFTLFILAQSWLVPILGYAMDLLGARVVVALGGILVGVSWVGSGLAQSLWGLYVFYALGGVGVAAAYGACLGLVLKWFPDRRGVAVGAVVGAYGSGAILTVVPIRHLIEAVGYRVAFMVCGSVLGVAVVLAAWPMILPHPGWRAPARRGSPPIPSSRGVAPTGGATPRQMLRSGTFYLLYVVAVLTTFGGLMLNAQLKPIAVAHGIDRVAVLPGVDALAMALMANLAVAALARPFWGWLSDRIGRYHCMAVAFALGGAAILGFLTSVRAPLAFVVSSSLVSFTWGASFVLFSAAVGDAFGTRYAATNNGIHYTSKGVAAIFAGWGAARLVETTGTWTPVFWVGVACNLIAAGLVFFVLRPTVERAAGMRHPPADGCRPTAGPGRPE
jgi:OFA family oxalate/formate antiporter-like MFS transporter